jgi:hypothetical protein
MKVELKCSGDSGEIHVGKKPDTVTFTCPARCAPLLSITPDPPAPGFTNKSTGPDGISYQWDGRSLPSGGCPFSYKTSELVDAGNGTGVIKN